MQPTTFDDFVDKSLYAALLNFFNKNPEYNFNFNEFSAVLLLLAKETGMFSNREWRNKPI